MLKKEKQETSQYVFQGEIKAMVCVYMSVYCIGVPSALTIMLRELVPLGYFFQGCYETLIRWTLELWHGHKYTSVPLSYGFLALVG